MPETINETAPDLRRPHLMRQRWRDVGFLHWAVDPAAHPAWPLRTAEVLQLDDGLRGSVGLDLLDRRAPDHVMFSDGVAVSFGMPVDARHPR